MPLFTLFSLFIVEVMAKKRGREARLACFPPSKIVCRDSGTAQIVSNSRQFSMPSSLSRLFPNTSICLSFAMS